jgi:tetratricopeptide (TPR) repeat protein
MSDEDWKQLLRNPRMLYSLMGETFLATAKYDEAEKMFRRANEESPNAPLLAYQLARIDAARHEWAEAQTKLDQYLDSEGSDAGLEPYALLREIVSATTGDDAKAERQLTQRLVALHSNEPNNIPLGYFLARLWLESGKLESSERLYRDLLRRRPAADGFRGLCEIYRRQQALKPLLEVLGGAVDQTGNLDLLGEQRTQLVESPHVLKSLFDMAQQAYEKDAAALSQSQHLALALLAAEAKQYDRAEQYGQLALEVPGRTKLELLEVLALTMYVAGENERAVRLFRQALAQEPDETKAAELHYFLAGALEGIGQTEEAIRAARQAVSAQSDSLRYLAREPWILYHAQRLAEAETAYRALLDRFDSDYESPGVREAMRQARFVLSNLCVMRDRLPEAEEWLEQVLDEFPEDPGALNDLGYLWADQQIRLQRALRMVRQAVEAEPDNAAYRDSLGWCLYHLGRYDEAIAELELAAKDSPPDSVILDHLGDAYAKADRRDDAVNVWRQAVELFRGQDGPDAKEQVEKIEAKIRGAESP